jgi:hypothetical protein
MTSFRNLRNAEEDIIIPVCSYQSCAQFSRILHGGTQIYTALALASGSRSKKKRTTSTLRKRNNHSHINLLRDLTLRTG